MANNHNIFSGKLVKLTSIRPDDAEVMAKWQDDADYLRRVDSDMAIPLSLKELQSQDEESSNHIQFRIRTCQDDRLVGFVALHGIEWNNGIAQLAIGIGNRSDRGKGYGKEALQLILLYAFYELNLHRVGLDVISYNTPAIRSYTAIGFQEEGRMREAVYRDGQRYDRIMMSILRKEWQIHKYQA